MTEDPLRCTRCDLCETRKNVVIQRGLQLSTFIIVGEAPGEDEDTHGLPFVGRSGRLLDKCLRAAGIPPEATTITNVIRCRPPENRRPTEVEINTCTYWLDNFLRARRPHLITALGRFSIGYFKGYIYDHTAKMTVRHAVGVPFKTSRLGDDTTVMPSWHPAYLLRTGGWAVEALIDHLRKARELHNRLARHL